jgi:hypothetical protein
MDRSLYLEIDGKPVRTPVIIGISDDSYTEVRRKYAPNTPTNAWPRFDSTERVLVGNLDVLDQQQATSAQSQAQNRPRP